MDINSSYETLPVEGKVIGKSSIRMADLMMMSDSINSLKKKSITTNNQGINVEIFQEHIDKKPESLGSLKIIHSSISKNQCIFDFVNSHSIVPIFAIDFSMANLTFQSDKCLHRTSQEEHNSYIDLIELATIAGLNQHPEGILAYGYGAKVIPKSTKEESLESSSQFALTGDYFNPLITSLKKMKNHYYQTLHQVQLSLPVNLSKILQHVNSLATMNSHNYLVVTVLTAGVIDDIDECIRSIIESCQLPVSIQIITLHNKNIKVEDLDTLKLEAQLKSSQFYQNRRQCVDFVFQEQFQATYRFNVKERTTNNEKQAWSQQLMRKLPYQIEKYQDIIQLDDFQSQFTYNLKEYLNKEKEQLLQECEDQQMNRTEVNTLIEKGKVAEMSIENIRELLVIDN